MIIYHKTNGKTVSTCVILGAGKSSVTHGSSVWEKHKEEVDKLTDNGDVYVTGGSYYGAVYTGKLEDRSKFEHYIKG